VTYIFVDCESYGGCPAMGVLTEFGAVEAKTRLAFHGVIVLHDPELRAIATEGVAIVAARANPEKMREVFTAFAEWLKQFESPNDRLIFVSDNPAWDWQWITDGFHRTFGFNPFGHSARRIGDYYAGLVGDWTHSTRWKSLRITPHDHNPVHDALGNLEAWERMQKGERAGKVRKPPPEGE